MKPGLTVRPDASIRRVAGAVCEIADRRDTAGAYPDVGAHGGCAFAVQHGAAGDDEVVGLLRGGTGAGREAQRCEKGGRGSPHHRRAL